MALIVLREPGSIQGVVRRECAAASIAEQALFLWIKRRRRQRLLSEPFPGHWESILDRNVTSAGQLPSEKQSRLRDILRILVAEKNWEGCGGLLISDEVKVTIAAHASRLLLGFDNEYFDQVRSILVYPDAYVAKTRTQVSQEFFLEHDSARLGEAWHRGTVVLSWAEVLANSRLNDGSNVVLHEFAHQLDMQNGRFVDGVPPLTSEIPFTRWSDVMAAEHARLRHDCEQGRESLLDCYGATDLAEFFAVATEAFFELSHPMRRRHPVLYELLRDFYRQDPLSP